MADPVARLVATLPDLTRNLEEALLPFWFPRSVDPIHGGYVWAVHRSGSRTTAEPEALNHASRLFKRIERHGHDPVHDGYLEMLERDWSVPSVRRASPIGGP